MKKVFLRFKYACNGIGKAFLRDTSFRWQCYLVLGVVFLTGIFLQELELLEIILIAQASFLILITELQNSALESALDKLHPELHHSIGYSKDLAAGAVLLAGILLVITLSLTLAF